MKAANESAVFKFIDIIFDAQNRFCARPEGQKLEGQKGVLLFLPQWTRHSPSTVMVCLPI